MGKKKKGVFFTIHNIVCVLGALFMVGGIFQLASQCDYLIRNWFAYSVYSYTDVVAFESAKGTCTSLGIFSFVFLLAAVICLSKEIDHPLRFIGSIFFCLLYILLTYTVCNTLYYPSEPAVLGVFAIYAISPAIIIISHLIHFPQYFLEKNQRDQLDLSLRYMCETCGSYSKEPLSTCPKCGENKPYKDRYKDIAVSPEQRFKCVKCGEVSPDYHEQCVKCGSKGTIIEQPTIPYVSDQTENTDNTSTQPMEKPLEDASDDGKKGLIYYDVVLDNGGSALMDDQEIEAYANRNAEQAVVSTEKTQSRFCRECGTKLPPEALFCPKCGTKVIYAVMEQEPYDDLERPEQSASGPNLDTMDVVTHSEEKIVPLVGKGPAQADDGYDFTKDLAPTLRRAFILLEDEEWEKADSYFERVLDSEPENAYAYIGKLLSAKQLTSISGLRTVEDLSGNKLFLRSLQYADNKFKQYLQSFC